MVDHHYVRPFGTRPGSAQRAQPVQRLALVGRHGGEFVPQVAVPPGNVDLGSVARVGLLQPYKRLANHPGFLRGQAPAPSQVRPPPEAQVVGLAL